MIEFAYLEVNDNMVAELYHNWLLESNSKKNNNESDTIVIDINESSNCISEIDI